jgi:hypothetical protein
MLRLLVYGYSTGVRSSRAIERKCTDDVSFRFLAADQAPDFRPIARFRPRHLDALADGSKFPGTGMVKICEPEEPDGLVTHASAADEATRTSLSAAGVRVVLAAAR